MGDLENWRWMVLKAVLFFGIALLCASALFCQWPSLECFAYQVLLVWSSCRLYYFFFYVIEKYIDPQFRFSSLAALAVYLIRKIGAPRRKSMETPSKIREGERSG